MKKTGPGAYNTRKPQLLCAGPPGRMRRAPGKGRAEGCQMRFSGIRFEPKTAPGASNQGNKILKVGKPENFGTFPDECPVDLMI